MKGWQPRLHVVRLTGRGERAAGVDRVLGKPARLEELLRTIGELSA